MTPLSVTQTPPPPFVAPGPLRSEDIAAGTLEVRLAQTVLEITAAQKLRYHVFVEEMGAHPSAQEKAEKRDFDTFDPYCDHLLVLEHEGVGPTVVGTYRLLRREPMEKLGRFYTEGEFDITRMKQFPGPILELGRSCVHENYRNRAVMQLLWRGIAAYLEKHALEVMFGCGSLHGSDPTEHRETLSYLYHYHLAPPELRLKALPERYTEMNLIPKEAINAKRAFAALPALIKGYLRLGGYVGEGAVIDAEYNTVDVGIIVKTDLVTAKYQQRYASNKDAMLPPDA